MFGNHHDLKKKKIAFIELETHANILIKWDVLLQEIPLFDYHFYLHEKLRDKVEQLPSEKISFLNNLNEFPKTEFDLVIINTFQRHFQDFDLIFKNSKTLCILHNLNFGLFFKSISLKNILVEKQSFLYFLKLYLKERIASKRKMVNNSNTIAVLSSSLKNYANTKISNKPAQVLNLNYNDHFLIENTLPLKIVIPGNVSSKRKDFDLVFNVFSKINPIEKIEFIFLGSIREEILKNKLLKLKNKCVDTVAITFFENYVAETEYQKIIKNAHLLFCPIKTKTSFYWVDEFYGKTKVSGNESDCITYGKIGIFPKTYPDFNWKTVSYSSEKELVVFFNNLNYNYLEKLYKGLEVYANQYTFDKVKEELKQKLLAII